METLFTSWVIKKLLDLRIWHFQKRPEKRSLKYEMKENSSQSCSSYDKTVRNDLEGASEADEAI